MLLSFLINDPFFEFGPYLSVISLLKQEDFFINYLPEPLLVQHEWNSLLLLLERTLVRPFLEKKKIDIGIKMSSCSSTMIKQE